MIDALRDQIFRPVRLFRFSAQGTEFATDPLAVKRVYGRDEVRLFNTSHLGGVFVINDAGTPTPCLDLRSEPTNTRSPLSQPVIIFQADQKNIAVIVDEVRPGLTAFDSNDVLAELGLREHDYFIGELDENGQSVLLIDMAAFFNQA